MSSAFLMAIAHHLTVLTNAVVIKTVFGFFFGMREWREFHAVFYAAIGVHSIWVVSSPFILIVASFLVSNLYFDGSPGVEGLVLLLFIATNAFFIILETRLLYGVLLSEYNNLLMFMVVSTIFIYVTEIFLAGISGAFVPVIPRSSLMQYVKS